MSRTIKSLLTFFALVFAVTAVATEAQAQCPTPPDFPGTPFNPGAPTLSWTDACGCTITVEWCWRTVMFGGNPLFFDFAITRITANCPLGVTPCATPDEIRLQAARLVIGTVNPWGQVIPCCPQTEDRWRLFTVACITDWWYDGVANHHRRDDCGDDVQCWSRMSVCFTCDNPTDPGDRGEMVVNETIINAGGTCPATWTTPYQTIVPCNGACQ